MQLPLVLLALAAASQAQLVMPVRNVAGALVGRQVVALCPAGTTQCTNQQGCCPRGAACLGNGHCDLQCSSAATTCSSGGCCEPGYTCPAVAGQPCEVAQTIDQTSTLYQTQTQIQTQTEVSVTASTVASEPTSSGVPAISTAISTAPMPQPTIAQGGAAPVRPQEFVAMPIMALIALMV